MPDNNLPTVTIEVQWILDEEGDYLLMRQDINIALACVFLQNGAWWDSISESERGCDTAEEAMLQAEKYWNAKRVSDNPPQNKGGK